MFPGRLRSAGPVMENRRQWLGFAAPRLDPLFWIESHAVLCRAFSEMQLTSRIGGSDRTPSECVPWLPAGTSSDIFRRKVLIATVVAFAVRMVAIVALRTYNIRPYPDHFEFGWEMGRIARSIAWGEGFSSPFGGHTGPTAWEPPLYPFLMAGVFKLFGVYSKLSAFALLTFNSLCAALTCIPLMLLGARVFGVRVARWAGWTWGLFPYFIYWAIRVVWETSFSTLLVCVLLYLSLRLAEDGTMRLWAAYGVLWSALALANPSALSLFPGFVGWIGWKRYRAQRGILRPVALMVGVLVIGVAPWLVRNYEVFGRFVFIRSNFGAEFRMGNSATARGLWMHYLNPAQNPLKLRRYEELGELEYVRQEQQQAFAYVRQHPGEFLSTSVKRAVYFWSGEPRVYAIPGAGLLRNSLFLGASVLAFLGLGLAYHRGLNAGPLLASTMLVYPLVYYFVYTMPRYRHLIEPEMLLFGCYLISAAASTRNRGSADASAERMPPEKMPATERSAQE